MFPLQSKSEILEFALIEYMELHPVKVVKLEVKNITQTQLSGVQKRLEFASLYYEIKGLVDALDRVLENGVGDYIGLQVDLVKALKPAIRMQNPTEQFLELLKRAERHLEF